MRFLIFALLSLSFTRSYAMTQGRFMGIEMMVNISTSSMDGSSDSTPEDLYKLMNRPEEDSMVGRGKAMDAPKKVLNFICAIRSAGNYLCTIHMHKSNYGKISFNNAIFEVQGAEAQHYFDQFHSQGGRFYFKNPEGTFLIDATPDHFLIKFAQGGV